MKKKPLGIKKDVSYTCSLKKLPLNQILHSGRASLKGSLRLKAGMAVEAAMAIPLLMLAIMSIYVYFTVLSDYTGLVMEQRDKGKTICVYANLYQSFLGVGDIVNLTESRQVCPVSPTLLNFHYNVKAPFYAHAWTGYSLTGDSDGAGEEEYVYITPEGVVYHKDINCSHLKLTIESTTMSMVGSLRNDDGAKYGKCEYCGNREYIGTLYVTKSGDCYHTTLGCPGLKRTIETIPISKVGNRAPCSRCGG